jgi:hypothetical protein
MQVFAVILFWILVVFLAATAVCVSFAMQASSELRQSGRALRAGTLRSVGGAFALQMLSVPAFIVLLVVTWSIQFLARQLGASDDAAIWVGMPVGVPALALPAIATLSGAYVGFRSGWLRAKGEDPQVVLAADTVARWLRRLGPLSPELW